MQANHRARKVQPKIEQFSTDYLCYARNLLTSLLDNDDNPLEGEQREEAFNSLLLIDSELIRRGLLDDEF